MALAGILRGGVTLKVGDLAVGADDECEVARGGTGEARRGGEQALWLFGGCCGLGLWRVFAGVGLLYGGHESAVEQLVVGGGETVVGVPGAGRGGALAFDGEGALLAGEVGAGGDVIVG